MSLKNNKSKNHKFFMHLALLQAKKNLGNTLTNPSVGCAIVKNNNLISLRSTSVSGRPHAESNAIKHSSETVNGSYLYSTLEPCSNYGFTTPCVNKIIKSKIKKVFFSLKDPDIKSFNKSQIKFKKKKINCIKGLNLNEITSFYRSYIKFKNKSLPFVTCKIAVSKDFFMKNNKNKFVTNNSSRSRVHMMRSEHDSLITSVNTVIEDNSKLNCRINGLDKFSPHVFILDKDLKLPIGSFIAKNSFNSGTTIFYNKINVKKINLLKKKNINLIKIDLKNNKLNLYKALYKIKEFGFSRVFLEAGLKLTESFLNYNLIDDFYLFVSKNKFKNNGKLSFKKTINLYLKNKKFNLETVNLFGDKLILYRLK